jgi:hypothetical protein
MPTQRILALVNKVPVFDLCSGPEKRFLLDLMQQEESVALDEHPILELYVLLRAIERMWGGVHAKQLAVPPELLYDISVAERLT